MRRRLLYSSDSNKFSTYADVVYYDSSMGMFLQIPGEYASDYTDSNYTPIGIVVVPSSHTDNSRRRVMSLVNMNCNRPTSGSTSASSMYWGNDVGSLESKNSFPYIGTSPNSVTTSGTVKFKNNEIYLPSDSNEENGLMEWPYDNPSNSIEHFYYNSNVYYYMCSPYKEDGSKDERYFSTSNTGNVLADFDGKPNTEKIIAQRGSRDYSSWTPWANRSSDYPAASCCDMFHTIGTNQGDWYLPSAGELGYALVRMQAIQNSLQTLKEIGYTVALLNLHYYWTSTKQSSETAVYMNFSNGYVNSYPFSNLSYPVRAFIEL